MTRFSLGENDSSKMRVGKVTLNNVCGLKAEKKKSWFQGAPLLSQLLRYWNNTSDVQQLMINSRTASDHCRNFASRICLHLPSLLIFKHRFEIRRAQGTCLTVNVAVIQG